ncbi:tetratricopeptide repeat protein [Streptomyces sp. NPDC059176]|uniref:tetratricopeptide repeat protein n=1 Tax=unclassified Streptomyces TaxID=2593676 RepID=UPI003683F1BF
MQRTHATAVLATGSVLLSVLVAVAVSVANSGTLPAAFAPLAWPLVGLLTAGTAVAAARQGRTRDAEPDPPSTAPGPDLPDLPELPDPAELPASSAHFVGRRTELDVLLGLVHQGHHALALTGAPGVGKSTLAVRLAHELRPLFPDGRLYADLGAGRCDPIAPAAVLAEFLAALGAPEEEQSGTPEALAARFRSRTAGRRVLLLLDDAADAAQLRPLLPGDGHSLALVTSRQALLDLPEAVAVPLGTLAESEALALLAAVAGPERIAGETGSACAIVHACGLLPLAVRIAAARLRAHPTRPVGELAGRLTGERGRLDELRVGNLAVRAGFEACYDTLDAEDQHYFRSLVTHPGLRLTARTAAAAADRPQVAARAALERLAAAQLVQTTGPDGYRLHDLIRVFAAERLERDTAPAERRAALGRIIALYTADATQHGSHAWGGHEQATVSLLVRAAAREGLHRPGCELALAADRWLWDQPSQLPRIAMWATVLDAARRSGEDRWAAYALRGLGAGYLHEGRYDRAVDHLRMSVAVQQRTGTRSEQIKTRRLLGDALRRAGRHEQALREFRAALDCYRELGTPMGEAEVLSSLGALHLDRRRPDEAIDCLEPAVATLVHRPGNPSYAADAQRSLGTAHVQAGNLTPAERHLRAALAAYRRHGRPVGEGWTLRELGRLEERRGMFTAAADHHRAALAVFEGVGHGKGVAAAAESIGDSLLAQGDEPGANVRYRHAVAVYGELGDSARQTEVRRKLGAA